MWPRGSRRRVVPGSILQPWRRFPRLGRWNAPCLSAGHVPRHSRPRADEMTARPLRVERALELLPELDDLLPLRDALIGLSRADGESAWTDAEAYATVESRLADADGVEAAIPGLVARIARRVEAVYREVVASLRAAERGDLAAASEALVAAGEVEEGWGRYPQAARYYDRAAEIGRSARDRRPEGLAHRRRARVAKAMGDLAGALELYGLGYEIAEAQRDVEGMVVACQGLGNVLVEQARWEEAEAWYLRGLERLGGQDPSRPRWQLESNLSLVTRRSGRLEESEAWLARARHTVERLGDLTGRVYVFNADGLLRVARGEPGRAEAAYREALRFAESPTERARVMVNLAESLLLQRRVAEAESTTRELEAITVEHGLIASLPYVYRGLGAVAGARRDEEGFLFYEQALDLCRTRGLPPFELALTQLEYAEFEGVVGRPASARARLEEACALFAELGTRLELERARSARAALEADAPELEPDGGN